MYYMVSLHDWENNTVAKIDSSEVDMKLIIGYSVVKRAVLRDLVLPYWTVQL